MLNRVWILVGKELVLEFRGREIVTLLLCTGLILSTLVGSGLSNAIVEARVVERIYPMLAWITFFFSAALSMTRAHDSELEGRGYEALLVAGVGGPAQFIAKCFLNTTLLMLGFAVSICGTALALDQSLNDILGPLCLIGLLVSLGMAPLMVLLSGIASASRLRGMLLPVLVLPLLFPYFLAGTELTSTLVLERSLDISSPWISLLIGADAIFILLGVNLYEYSLRD